MMGTLAEGFFPLFWDKHYDCPVCVWGVGQIIFESFDVVITKCPDVQAILGAIIQLQDVSCESDCGQQQWGDEK